MAYRTQKLNSLLHETLANIIERELDYPGVLVTIISISVSDDGADCSVRLGILPHAAAEKTLKKIRTATGFIKHHIAEKLNLRIIPELTFSLDEGTLNAERVEILLDRDKNKEGGAQD
jgi:ribosome-binding factor A